MKKRFLFILLVGMFASIQMASAQSTLLNEQRKRELGFQSESMFKGFISTHNLLVLKSQKKLKEVAGQEVCVPVKYGYESPKLQENASAFKQIFAAIPTNTAKGSNEKPQAQEMEVICYEVKKVYSDWLSVTYKDKKYNISTNDSRFKNLMLKSDYDEIQGKIKALYDDAEREAAEKGKENLERYHEAIAKFHQGSTGLINVGPSYRLYEGKTSFQEYCRDGIVGSDTFLDETFVFKKQELQNAVAKDLQATNAQAYLDMQDDTLGIYKDPSGTMFINLRTGGLMKDYELVGNSKLYLLLESTTYLNCLSQAKPFVYDGTYSLQEVLDYYHFRPTFPEKICEALAGEKVVVLKENDYDEDEIERVGLAQNYRNELYYVITTKKNGVVDLRRTITVKWYEQLQKFIGKKVIRERDNSIIYQETLPTYTIWTVDRIDATYNQALKGLDLFMSLSNANKPSESVNVIGNCKKLTHSIDLYKENAQGQILSYDYLKENAPKMPKDEKEMRQALGNLMVNAVEDSFVELSAKAMTLSMFRKNHPNAKLVKSSVNNSGQHIRVYHVNGYEVIFVNNKCTTVTRL